jgi:hypothetical protein
MVGKCSLSALFKAPRPWLAEDFKSIPTRPRFPKVCCKSLQQLVLAHPVGGSQIFGVMREILPGIFTWGSTYVDRPWDLNGYAIMLEGCTVLVDPPAPGEEGWSSFDLMKPIVHLLCIVFVTRTELTSITLGGVSSTV